MLTLIEGVLLGLSVAAPVGPTNIELIRRGLKSGFLWFVALSALLHSGRRTPRVFKVISAIAGLVLIGFGVNFGYRIIQSYIFGS